MPLDENFKYDEVYERGAVLLTVLAYPQRSDPTRSLQLYLSLCGKALWLRHLVEQDDWTPIRVRPQYVFRDYQRIDRDVGFVVKRVRERMIAGRMAILFLQQAHLGRLPSLPKEIQRLSLNQVAELVLDDAGQAETGNLEARVWALSRPVIHLAAAAAIVGQQLRKSGHQLALETLLFDRWAVESVVSVSDLNADRRIGETPRRDADLDTPLGRVGVAKVQRYVSAIAIPVAAATAALD